MPRKPLAPLVSSEAHATGVDDPSKRGAYHHGNLRDAFIQRGIELLDLEGAAALSLRRASRDLNVSQTAPMHHFEGKVGYLSAVAAEGFRMLFDARVRSLRGAVDPKQRLMAVLLVHIQFAIDHGALFRLMFGTEIPDKASRTELWTAITRSYGVLENCVADYLFERKLTSEQLNASTFAAWTACHGLALLVINREDSSSIARADPMKIGAEVLAIFVAGLDSQRHPDPAPHQNR